MTDDAVDGMHEKFAAFQELIKMHYGEAVYDSWFSSLALDQFKDQSATLSVNSQVQAEKLNQQFRSKLKLMFCERVGPVSSLFIVSRKEALSKSAEIATAKHSAGIPSVVQKTLAGFDFGDDGASDTDAKWSEAAKRDTPKNVKTLSVADMAAPIMPRSTFEAFYKDGTNELGLAAAKRLFVDGANVDSVYLYGESGVGKTHLLSAIGHEWAKRFPEKRYAYITYPNMRDGCSNAAMTGNLYTLHQDFLSYDLVMIDDIHRLLGKKRSITEILNLANAFASTGRQLVIAGEGAPAQLAEAGLDPRLADRLAGGLSAEMLRASDDLRVDVLKGRRAEDKSECTITDEAIEFVARHFRKSMRETIGMFNQLTLVYGDRAIQVGENEARIALQSHLRARRANTTLEDVLRITGAVFGLTVEDLKGRAQPQRIARGRHAFVMVGREQMKESFPQLGRALSRDHTTAMSSYDRAQALFEREEGFREKIAAIRAEIGM